MSWELMRVAMVTKKENTGSEHRNNGEPRLYLNIKVLQNTKLYRDRDSTHIAQ